MFANHGEKLGKMLDVDYSNVNIKNIVDNLDIANATKQKL